MHGGLSFPATEPLPLQPCAVVCFIACLAGILTPWVVFGLASCYCSVAVASRVAQMVVRLARYQKVGGSNPPRGVNFSACRTLLYAFNFDQVVHSNPSCLHCVYVLCT